MKQFMCPINECGAEIPKEALLCKKHWDMVPHGLQVKVFEASLERPYGTPHLMAMKHCIDSVNDQLRKREEAKA